MLNLSVSPHLPNIARLAAPNAGTLIADVSGHAPDKFRISLANSKPRMVSLLSHFSIGGW